jgi:hypothetical protein
VFQYFYKANDDPLAAYFLFFPTRLLKALMLSYPPPAHFLFSLLHSLTLYLLPLILLFLVLTERANVEKVNTLDQQLTDKFNELMIKRVQLRGTIHKEVENTQKKLEKVREDIKKEEKQTQGLSAESDKTNNHNPM